MDWSNWLEWEIPYGLNELMYSQQMPLVYEL